MLLTSWMSVGEGPTASSLGPIHLLEPLTELGELFLLFAGWLRNDRIRNQTSLLGAGRVWGGAAGLITSPEAPRALGLLGGFRTKAWPSVSSTSSPCPLCRGGGGEPGSASPTREPMQGGLARAGAAPGALIGAEFTRLSGAVCQEPGQRADGDKRCPWRPPRRGRPRGCGSSVPGARCVSCDPCHLADRLLELLLRRCPVCLGPRAS